MKNTSARQQAKQILTLSKQVSNLTKQTRTKFNTTWELPATAIDSVSTGGNMYICHVPYAPCDPYRESTTNLANAWSDNAIIPGPNAFQKNVLFQAPEHIKFAQKIYHTGSVIKYQVTTNEFDYTKITLALLRPKKNQASQIVIDRKLWGGLVPGTQAKLEKETDYITHTGASSFSGTPTDTTFGLLWNLKNFDVLYSREMAFSHPGAGGAQGNVSSANTNPQNNAFIHTGTIRMPKGGLCMNKSIQEVDPLPLNKNQVVNALGTCVLDQRPENCCFLVAFSNGASIDSQTIQLSARVVDSYTAVN